ncbi:cytochrome c biogenesis protein ResB [Thermovibrio ammonificans]|uniref:ResB family protein n=1 Tax=Thermovibrio ammonificans (strain DSM 15698 / JCM 12110 / HB-1) TaxID=648996 RepID=E8T4R9_THEA1|nr:cytochrome c biogenesis protein ResB [Thermovibrio ammonificans]ADU96331.1 ResB family protein [Thermovibrio ammonificans HB-1]
MFKAIYDFFSSVKLAIVLLLTLAVTSIVGTIIEQQQNPEKYLMEYGETTYKIMKFLGFTDVYHSWWYISLLTLLAINLIVCSIKRLPKIWKVAMEPRKTLPPGYEKSLRVSHSITLSAPAQAVKEKVIEALKQLKYKVEVAKETENEIHVFADKHVFARFGVYIVHLGVLVVLIGGLVTAIFGYRGYMNLAEGTASNLVSFFSGPKIIELPFYVKCNKFKIDFYPSGMPKAYISDLTIIENGKPVLRKTIEVNKPLKYRGIYFYQASYGQGEAFLRVRDTKGHEKLVGVAFGQPVKFGKGVYLRIVSLDGNTGTLGVELIENGKVQDATIRPFMFYRVPGTDKLFSVVDFKPVFYTGLQVSKDPGTWIVWVGSTILIVGLIVAFFVPHRRVWARIEKKGEEKTRLVIGGLTNKGTEGLAQDLEKVLGVLKSSYCQNTPKEDES